MGPDGPAYLSLTIRPRPGEPECSSRSLAYSDSDSQSLIMGNETQSLCLVSQAGLAALKFQAGLQLAGVREGADPHPRLAPSAKVGAVPTRD